MKIYVTSVISEFDYPTDKILKKIHREKRQRMLRYRFKADFNKSLIGETLVRYALMKEKKSITDPIFIYGEKNKPYLKNLNYYFNISHSGNYVICVIDSEEVGVDIQEMKAINRADSLDFAKRFFSKLDFELLKSAKDYKTQFYSIWTLKEAYCKYKGDGLYLAPDSYFINFKDGSVTREDSDYLEFRYFYQQKIDNNYMLAVCADKAIPGVIHTISHEAIVSYMNNI